MVHSPGSIPPLAPACQSADKVLSPLRRTTGTAELRTLVAVLSQRCPYCSVGDVAMASNEDQTPPSAAGGVSYRDVFEVALTAGDNRCAEQLIRTGLEGAPHWIRTIVPVIHRRVLLLRLRSLADPGCVLGWQIESATPQRVVLKAESPLADAMLTGERTDRGTVRLTTELRYHRPIAARTVWTAVGPLHRRVAPILLARAARPAVPQPSQATKWLELSQGPIEYADSGGSGPTVVLVNAALTDHTLWTAVVDRLAPTHRCISVVLPLGAHRRPMHPHADRSLRGQAKMLADILDCLNLDDVTLCFNDWSGAQIMVAEGWLDRVSRLVLISCETDGNYPPGLPGRFLGLLGKTPYTLDLGYFAMHLPLAHRLPFTFGLMTHKPFPRDLARLWFRPGQRDRRIRRDLFAYVSDTREAGRHLTEATSALATFDKPVLVVWGADDRVMPRAEGQRLSEAFVRSLFVTLEHSGTFVPLDQPLPLADALQQFIRQTDAAEQT